MKSRGIKEKIAFHKGALATLISERRVIVRALTAVNHAMMVHIKTVKDMGIDLKNLLKSSEGALKCRK